MGANEPDKEYQVFVAQAKKCEQRAAENPGRYRRSVIGLAVLGYGFAPAIALLLLGGFVALVWAYFSGDGHGGGLLIAKLGIVVLGLAFIVFRAMNTSFGRTEGVQLRRRDAPEFFAFVDGIRARTGNPKVHRLFITDEMNAAVRQTPRLGLLGFHRNDLIIGLPLIQALGKDELSAVIAHEFGHLSGAHGKIGAWIYRTRRMMFQILENIEESDNGVADWLLGSFYRKFVPHFSAYSFALAREQEYEADRMAAGVTSPQTVVNALTRLHMAATSIDQEFWENVWRGTASDERPPENVYALMGAHLRSPESWKFGALGFRSVVNQETDYGDTHPCLTDRARALDIAVQPPPPAQKSALDLLPEGGTRLMAQFSTQWFAAAGENWIQQHEEMQELRRRFEALEEAAAKAPLEADDAMLRGHLAERFLAPGEALARIEDAIAWTGGSPVARYVKGRVLLDLDREEGIALLEDVMAQDSDATVSVCELIETYLIRHGRDAEAEVWQAIRLPQEKILQEDQLERNQLTREDRLEPHTCSQEEVDRIVAVVTSEQYHGIGSAWLVRKQTTHRQWVPAHFLICFIGLRHADSVHPIELQDALSEALAGLENLAVLVCHPADDWVRDMVREVSGAQIMSGRR